MIWRIDVRTRPGFEDTAGRGAAAALREAGLAGVRDVAVARVYLVDASWDEGTARRLSAELFADSVLEELSVEPGARPPSVPSGTRVALVFKKPGVMDPVEESALKAIADLGASARRVRCGTRYDIRGTGDLIAAVAKTMANEAVDEIIEGERAFENLDVGTPYRFRRIDVPLRGDLGEVNRRYALALSPRELQAVQAYFETLGRDPTDVELETIAQTWSEHCKHKTFAGEIEYRGEKIRNLLRSTIMKATRELNRPWCVSVFKDNAGIVEFDDELNVCFKVETHNHPSAIDPYGGANTGIGGVIRDVLGCGLGAKPIASTDVFCVGRPDAPSTPPGTLHPRRILRGVVAGVRDYGNRMGIPTVNGAVLCDERYAGNPLVFCGTVGILPKEKSFKRVRSGDAIVVVGGRTGRDGIHGATFSSVELHEKSEQVSSGAVQIGNAIVEKRMLDTVLQARDRGLYDGITDCGAGGLSSAVGEMGEETGAEVDLEKVPLKYEGLSYAEIWISEAQERMVLSVSPEKVDALLGVFRAENVEATVIGRFTEDRKLRLRYEGQEVASLDMEFLHRGMPEWTRAARYDPKSPATAEPREKSNYGDDLRALLSSWSVCSKEWIIRQYDHEVQGGSVVKPLVGARDEGPSDAAVVRPVLRSYRGLAIGCGINPTYGDFSAYDMAACAIDEAMRNVVAVGGDPERTALLDNFSWGSPEDPENLGALVEAARACYDVAVAYGTPFVSGKDSLNNEFRIGDRRIVIPHTLLISAIAIVEDVRRCVTMDLKKAGDAIYIVGMTKKEREAPRVDVAIGKRIFSALSQSIRAGAVRACHDLSEGGLAVAAAEMAFAGDLGMRIDLSRVPSSSDAKRNDVLLFSESASRFLVEAKDAARFESLMAGVPIARIGEVTADRRLRVEGAIDEPIEALKEAWQRTMRW